LGAFALWNSPFYTRKNERPTLVVSLTTPAIQEVQQDEINPVPTPEPPDQVLPEQPMPVTPEETRDTPVKRLTKSPREIVRAYTAESGQTHGVLIQPCNLVQRATEIRNCPEDDAVSWRNATAQRNAGTFDLAFVPHSINGQFQQDMAMVDELMKQQEELEEVTRSLGFESELIAEKQRDIRANIARIDRQYAQLNLFKVIGYGVKKAGSLLKTAK
jgi:hypothetical protein